MEGVTLCVWAAKGKHIDDNSNFYSSYIPWTGAKFIIRSIATAFLILLFTKVNARALPVVNQNSKNYVLVPAVMLGVLSMFGEGLIDQKFGKGEELLRCAIKDLGLKILFDVGPPMHLGFLLHVFLYFIIIQTRLRNYAQELGPGQGARSGVNQGPRMRPGRGRGRGRGRGWDLES